MAFGQQQGPPATARQLQELLTLLQAAGHADFRDARGPMGFTQRQGNGKFTRDEASELIEQLQAEVDAADAGGAEPEADGAAGAARAVARPAPRSAAVGQRSSAAERSLRRMPAEALAAELQRRGWVVMEP